MSHPTVPPEPQRPPGVHAQTPVVYVEPSWEYKHLGRDLTKEAPPGEAELNALGADGWELAAAFVCGNEAHFYFKRETG